MMGLEKMGNLKRDCAAAVSRIIKGDKAKSNKYLKPLHEAVVKKQAHKSSTNLCNSF